MGFKGERGEIVDAFFFFLCRGSKRIRKPTSRGDSCSWNTHESFAHERQIIFSGAPPMWTYVHLCAVTKVTGLNHSAQSIWYQGGDWKVLCIYTFHSRRNDFTIGAQYFPRPHTLTLLYRLETWVWAVQKQLNWININVPEKKQIFLNLFFLVLTTNNVHPLLPKVQRIHSCHSFR